MICFIEWALSKTFPNGDGTVVHYASHDVFYWMFAGQWNWIGDDFGNGTYVPTEKDFFSFKTTSGPSS